MTCTDPSTSAECPCGSGEVRRALYDARRIFVAYICPACEQRVRAGYRADIFTDTNYWADEPIEEP